MPDNSSKKGQKGNGKGEKYLTGAPVYKVLPKAIARSYPAPNGSVLLTGARSLSEYFTVNGLRDWNTPEVCDLVARLTT
eukprot:4761494-Karenia_brevis.AAC.1